MSFLEELAPVEVLSREDFKIESKKAVEMEKSPSKPSILVDIAELDENDPDFKQKRDIELSNFLKKADNIFVPKSHPLKKEFQELIDAPPGVQVEWFEPE